MLIHITDRYPVLSYIFLCYLITWSIWFSIPAVVGANWPLIKIYTGIGLGPGLAAVLLYQIRYGSTNILKQAWWRYFIFIIIIVSGINISILITGDGINYEDLASSTPPGMSWRGIIGTILSAIVVAYIFASAAVSKWHTLNSIRKWRVHWKWWFLAISLFPASYLLSYLFGYLLNEEMIYFFDNIDKASKISYGIRSLLFTLFIVGIGEEVGWRGYMLPELQRKYNPVVSSIIVGIVWGFWHLPLFFIGAYPGEPIDITAYIFIGPLLALLFTWLFNHSGGNLLLMIVLHATINNTGKFIPSSSFEPIFIMLFIVFLVIKYKMWLKRDVKFISAKTK